MNGSFKIKRFGTYLAYDIRNAWNNYKFSLLVQGLLPSVVFGIYEVLGRLVSGEWTEYNAINQYTALWLGIFLITISFPSKAYGRITEKRYGSEWLTLPASGVEKWLSMIAVTCVILPLSAGILLFGCDALLSALFADYGRSALSGWSELIEKLDSLTANYQISFNLNAVLYLNWVENILAFTLGAICFKNSKIAKTILCYIAAGFIVSNLALGIFGRLAFVNLSELQANYNLAGVDSGQCVITFCTVFYSVVITGLLAGCYIRIKTIKQ